MPGLVSTLLNHAYSIPGRLVQTFLQVTEQVWQPMHLSRFSTMPICARIFIVFSLGPIFSSRRLIRRDFAIQPIDLVHLAHHDKFVAVGADGAVIVETVD